MFIEHRVKHTDDRDNDSELTAFTEKDDSGHVNYRLRRPALLVSSTSWTGPLITVCLVEDRTMNIEQNEMLLFNYGTDAS